MPLAVLVINKLTSVSTFNSEIACREIEPVGYDYDYDYGYDAISRSLLDLLILWIVSNFSLCSPTLKIQYLLDIVNLL